MNSQQNLNVKSTTKVTIASQKAPEPAPVDVGRRTAHPQPRDDPRTIVSDSTLRQQMAKEVDSSAAQLKSIRATAENFKGVVDLKDRSINDLRVGVTLLRDSIAPLDNKILAVQNEALQRHHGELDMLRRKVDEAAGQEAKFKDSVASFKKDVDGKNASLAAHKKRLQLELDELKRGFEADVENSRASIKELQKVHQQVSAENVRMSDEKKYQIDKDQALSLELQQLYSEMEKIGHEKKSLNKKLSQLEAGLLELKDVAQKQKESTTLAKTEDNKKKLVMCTKQVTSAVSQRDQKKKQLSSLGTKLTGLSQERDALKDERLEFESIFNEKMEELNSLTNENLQKQQDINNVKKRTEEFQNEMLRKIEEARRRSESYTNELLKEMELTKRASVVILSKAEEKRRRERDEREKAKDELRSQLEKMNQTLSGLQQVHEMEMEAKRSFFGSVENELEVFGVGEKEGTDEQIEFIKANIEKLGVQRSRDKAEFDQVQADVKEEMEVERQSLAMAKKISVAMQAIEKGRATAEQAKQHVKSVERELDAKKKKFLDMNKDAYDLRRMLKDLGQTDFYDPDLTDNDNKQNQQVGLRQAEPKFHIDGPVMVSSEEREDGEWLEQMSIAGSTSKFTLQTVSKTATATNPAEYRVETQQMELNVPGNNPNIDMTTKIRQVIYSGQGVDKNVLDEAKKILAIHKDGVKKVHGESEKELQLREELVNRARELSQHAENLEFMRSENMGTVCPELQRKEEDLVRMLQRSQNLFADMTQQLQGINNTKSSLSESIEQLENGLANDRALIEEDQQETRRQSRSLGME